MESATSRGEQRRATDTHDQQGRDISLLPLQSSKFTSCQLISSDRGKKYQENKVYCLLESCGSVGKMSLFQPEPSIIGYIHKCPLSLICSVEAVGSVTAVTTAEGTSGFFLFPDMKCHTYANVSAMPGTDIFNHNDNVFLSHKKFSSC